MDKKDPMYRFLKDKGVVVEDELRSPVTTAVFSFPIKAPDGAICRNDRGAIEQLDLWLIYQRHWCEHKPSVTISVRDEEWPEVIAWVWKHFDELSGVSFLPHDNGSYQQAPYEDILDKNVRELKLEYKDWTPGEILDSGLTESDFWHTVSYSAKEQYEAMVAAMPTDIKFEEMLEGRDNTEGMQTLACSSAGGCEL